MSIIFWAILFVKINLLFHPSNDRRSCNNLSVYSIHPNTAKFWETSQGLPAHGARPADPEKDRNRVKVKELIKIV
jgi:hypothetical protein